MQIAPKYAENIIVAIIHKGNLSWYIADKEIWYMDYKKRIRVFEENGYSINVDHIDDLRKKLLVLDENTVELFIEKLVNFEVTAEALKKFLKEEKKINDEWNYDLSPSLYIDFDKRILYTAYREMDNYENYIPKGWKAEPKEFLYKIPLSKRYWLDDKRKSYFEEIVYE